MDDVDLLLADVPGDRADRAWVVEPFRPQDVERDVEIVDGVLEVVLGWVHAADMDLEAGSVDLLGEAQDHPLRAADRQRRAELHDLDARIHARAPDTGLFEALNHSLTATVASPGPGKC